MELAITLDENKILFKKDLSMECHEVFYKLDGIDYCKVFIDGVLIKSLFVRRDEDRNIAVLFLELVRSAISGAGSYEDFLQDFIAFFDKDDEKAKIQYKYCKGIYSTLKSVFNLDYSDLKIIEQKLSNYLVEE